VNHLIREASIDDAEELREFATRLFAERLPGVYERPSPTLEQELQFISAHTDSPRSVLLVATVDDRIAGLVALQARQLPQEHHVAALGVSVDQRYRGRGLGSALITAVLEWARVNGITRVELEAFAANPRAIALYERLGFEREGARRAAVMIDGAPVDAIMLARLLEVTP